MLQIAEHPYILYPLSIERKQRAAGPGQALLRGRVTHEFVLMNSCERHFRNHLVSLRHKFLYVTCIFPQGVMHHIDVFGESGMAPFLLTQGSPEGDVLMEDERNRRFVMGVPQ